MAEVEADRGSFWQRNLLIFFVFIMIAAIPLEWLLDTATELSPDHSDAVMWSALGLGIVTAIIFLTIILILKPASRSSTVRTAIAFAFCGIILGTLLGMSLVGMAFQFIDFWGPNVTRKFEDFPIARAYKTHGKSACDHIQLRDYFGDFCINAQEYKVKFDDSEDTRPEGYCLHVDAERNGDAIRIMHSSNWAFRPGVVVTCLNRLR